MQENQTCNVRFWLPAAKNTDRVDVHRFNSDPGRWEYYYLPNSWHKAKLNGDDIKRSKEKAKLKSIAILIHNPNIKAITENDEDKSDPRKH